MTWQRGVLQQIHSLYINHFLYFSWWLIYIYETSQTFACLSMFKGLPAGHISKGEPEGSSSVLYCHYIQSGGYFLLMIFSIDTQQLNRQYIKNIDFTPFFGRPQGQGGH